MEKASDFFPPDPGRGKKTKPKTSPQGRRNLWWRNIGPQKVAAVWAFFLPPPLIPGRGGWLAALLQVSSLAVLGDVTSNVSEPSDRVLFPDSLMSSSSFRWGRIPAREVFWTPLGELWAPLIAPQSDAFFAVVAPGEERHHQLFRRSRWRGEAKSLRSSDLKRLSPPGKRAVYQEHGDGGVMKTGGEQLTWGQWLGTG